MSDLVGSTRSVEMAMFGGEPLDPRTRTIASIACWAAPLLAGIVLASLIASGRKGAGLDPPRERAPQPVRDDHDQLQGYWVAATIERDGVPIYVGQEAKKASLSFQGDEVTFHDDEVTVRGLFELDPYSNPRAFDLIVSEGGTAPTRAAGIYSLADGELRLCFVFPAGERPKHFATRPGSGLTLFAYHRAGIENRAGRDRRPDPSAIVPLLATFHQESAGNRRAEFTGSRRLPAPSFRPRGMFE